MPDITLTELKAVVPDGEEVKDYIDGLAALPAEASWAEILVKLIKYSHDAARVKNQTLTPGNLVNAYPAPTATAPVVDPNTGVYSFIGTFSVVARVPAFMDGSVGIEG
ncbi:hypothetical protein QQ056_09395 [Oscillatoria laete-virens NRMC-F 0139]|nr:hypothetical protein [Oscillatoria laete-virens]MDL5053757.1 hypothetical protein [Oscillatoria laete-virens NRMC-F 0139]